MRIGHAVMNENGKARGGLPGSQTKKELRIQEWYPREGGWDLYLEPKDPDLADKAVSWIERIIEDDRFGYDQDRRWSGYKEIKEHGFDGAGKGDFDCSSLIISCYIFAGLKLKPTGYTGNMDSLLMETDAFILHNQAAYLYTTDLLKPGGILIAKGKHTCMCLDEGREVKQIDEVFPSEKAIGRVTAKGSVRIRNNPKTGSTVRIARKNETLNFYTEDLETGWLYTVNGWITCNPKYVEVEYFD